MGRQEQSSSPSNRQALRLPHSLAWHSHKEPVVSLLVTLVYEGLASSSDVAVALRSSRAHRASSAHRLGRERQRQFETTLSSKQPAMSRPVY